MFSVSIDSGGEGLIAYKFDLHPSPNFSLLPDPVFSNMDVATSSFECLCSDPPPLSALARGCKRQAPVTRCLTFGSPRGAPGPGNLLDAARGPGQARNRFETFCGGPKSQAPDIRCWIVCCRPPLPTAAGEPWETLAGAFCICPFWNSHQRIGRELVCSRLCPHPGLAHVQPIALA